MRRGRRRNAAESAWRESTRCPPPAILLSTPALDIPLDFCPAASVSATVSEEHYVMDSGARERVQQLFVEITSLLEDAHKRAAKGQAKRVSAATLRALTQELSASANRLLTLAAAIDVILGGHESTKTRRRTNN